MPKPIMVPQLSPQEMDMAKLLIRSMDKAFEPALYEDTYRARLLSAIQAKIQGQEIVSPKDKAIGNVIDLMEALQQSLAVQGTPPPMPPVYSGIRQ